jgi:hypothetical protein
MADIGSGAFLGLVLAEFVALVRGLFATPILRSDYCDFPEQCLDIFQHDAFATARWIWWAGVAVAAVAVVVKVASRAEPRLAGSWAVGAAALLLVATGFLTPVLWDTAASLDRYSVVTILSVQYLLALLLLQICALLLVHDITGWRIAPRQERQPSAA